MDLGFGPDRKSPELAQLLSIIPGLGHIYAGDYLTGIIWFVLFIPVLFALGIFEVIFYGWNSLRPALVFIFAYITLVILSARELLEALQNIMHEKLHRKNSSPQEKRKKKKPSR